MYYTNFTGLSNTVKAFPQLHHSETGRVNEARLKGADSERMRRGFVGGMSKTLMKSHQQFEKRPHFLYPRNIYEKSRWINMSIISYIN